MLFGQPQIRHSQVTLMVKKTPTKAGDVRDMGLIPGLGDSLQDAQQPLQYSCLDRGA